MYDDIRCQAISQINSTKILAIVIFLDLRKLISASKNCPRVLPISLNTSFDQYSMGSTGSFTHKGTLSNLSSCSLTLPTEEPLLNSK